MGGWAGFSVGWLYWYFWVIVVGFEAVAGAKVIAYCSRACRSGSSPSSS
jgi:GABA permease